MKLKHRYILLLFIPPLVILLPVAIAFIAIVTRTPHWPLMALITAIGYVSASIVSAFVLARSAERVEAAVASQRNVAVALSACLQRTEFVSLLLWLGTGFLLALTGFNVVMPTFLGLQYFAEAALLIAAPAMAWMYWTSKRVLLGAAHDVPELGYHGRHYSIGIKIAMVFIGFFVISVGALVHLVTARVVVLLEQGAVRPDTIAMEIGTYGLVIALSTTVVFAIATYFLARDITAPLDHLVRVAGAMAEGRLDVAPRVFSDDEIGRLGERFAVTRAQLRDLVSRVSNRGGAITSGVRVIREGTDILVNGAIEQSGMTQQSVVALQQVRGDAESVVEAVGKVTEAAGESASSATELRASFEEVALRTDDLFRSVEKSSSGTNQIDASARETLHRASVLSNISSELLSFVAEMDATIRNIHSTAEETEKLAEEVSDNAQAGGAAVSETVEGIRAVQDSARKTSDAFDALQESLGKIGQVLTFIDELTYQTNLLSFNAAIIAAHAGKNDYGFSVIADEVRGLADRTREATKEISSIIRSVQPVAKQAHGAIGEAGARVERTVELAQNAATSLATILDSAQRSKEMSRMMAHSLNEQARATQRLHETTATMTDHVEEIHRATRGQAEATQLLAVEAERVSDIAGEVRRATSEQMIAGSGIAKSMEQIANDVRGIRDRLARQLQQADQIAIASNATLTIARKNNEIASNFSTAIAELVTTGRSFDDDLARFRV